MAPDFDKDTALEQTGEGRWRGNVPKSWWIVAGPNGGFMAALAARVGELVSPLPLGSLTTHFLEAPAEGPIDVTARLTRQGRSAAFVSIFMHQEGRLVVQAGMVGTLWRDDTPSWSDAVMPEAPPPEECIKVDPARTGVAPVVGNYDIRMAPRVEEAVGWIRTVGARPADRPPLTAYTDAFVPPAMLRTSFGVLVPTLELTVHARGQMPDDPHPWILGRFTSRVAAGGTIEEDGELWSADGRLLAMSRQLSLIRPGDRAR